MKKIFKTSLAVVGMVALVMIPHVMLDALPSFLADRGEVPEIVNFNWLEGAAEAVPPKNRLQTPVYFQAGSVILYSFYEDGGTDITIPTSMADLTLNNFRARDAGYVRQLSVDWESVKQTLTVGAFIDGGYLDGGAIVDNGTLAVAKSTLLSGPVSINNTLTIGANATVTSGTITGDGVIDSASAFNTDGGVLGRSVTVAGTSALTGMYTGQVSGLLALDGGSCQDTYVDAGPVAVGNTCTVGPPAAGPGATIVVSCFVSAASAVKIHACNLGTANLQPASGNYQVRVFAP